MKKKSNLHQKKRKTETEERKTRKKLNKTNITIMFFYKNDKSKNIYFKYSIVFFIIILVEHLLYGMSCPYIKLPLRQKMFLKQV